MRRIARRRRLAARARGRVLVGSRATGGPRGRGRHPQARGGDGADPSRTSTTPISREQFQRSVDDLVGRVSGSNETRSWSLFSASSRRRESATATWASSRSSTTSVRCTSRRSVPGCSPRGSTCSRRPSGRTSSARASSPIEGRPVDEVAALVRPARHAGQRVEPDPAPARVHDHRRDPPRSRAVGDRERGSTHRRAAGRRATRRDAPHASGAGVLGSHPARVGAASARRAPGSALAAQPEPDAVVREALARAASSTPCTRTRPSRPYTFSRSLLARARNPKVRRVVVDVRLNGGGDNTSYSPLLDALRARAINRPGRLVLLTGPRHVLGRRQLRRGGGRVHAGAHRRRAGRWKPAQLRRLDGGRSSRRSAGRCTCRRSTSKSSADPTSASPSSPTCGADRRSGPPRRPRSGPRDRDLDALALAGSH